MSLSHLIYTSKSAQAMDDMKLQSIQQGARENNPKHNITGLLLYGGGHFLQLLEGEWEAVDKVFDDCIANDVKHQDVRVLFRSPANKRIFPSWSMGVVNMTSETVDLDVRELWNSFDLDRAIRDNDSGMFYELFDAFSSKVGEMPLAV